MLYFPMEEMKELSGGKGVILMVLNEKERLVSALATRECVTISGVGRGDKQIEHKVCAEMVDNYAGRRARKGKALPVKFKRVQALS